MSTGAFFWKDATWEAGRKALAERPRRRTLQQLPPDVIAVCSRGKTRQRDDLPIAA